MKKSSHSSRNRRGKSNSAPFQNQQDYKFLKQYDPITNKPRKTFISVSKLEKENKKPQKSNSSNYQNIRIRSNDSGLNQKFYFQELPPDQQLIWLRGEVNEIYQNICFLRNELLYQQEQLTLQKRKMKQSENKVVQKACLDSELSAEIVRLRFQSQELSDQKYEIEELISSKNLSDLRVELFEHKNEIKRLQRESSIYNEKIAQINLLIDNYTSTEYHKQSEIIVKRYDELKSKLRNKVDLHHKLKNELDELRKSFTTGKKKKKKLNTDESNEIKQLYLNLDQLKDYKEKLILQLKSQREEFEADIQSPDSQPNKKQKSNQNAIREMKAIDSIISIDPEKKEKKNSKKKVHPPETLNTSHRPIRNRSTNCIKNRPARTQTNPRRRKYIRSSNDHIYTEISEKKTHKERISYDEKVSSDSNNEIELINYGKYNRNSNTDETANKDDNIEEPFSIKQQSDFYASNHQNELNASDKQNEMNEIYKQNDMNEIYKQNEMNEIDQQNEMNEMDQQKDLNESDNQNEMNEIDQQKDLNESDNQNEMDEIDQQKDLNASDHENDRNAIDHKNESEGEQSSRKSSYADNLSEKESHQENNSLSNLVNTIGSNLFNQSQNQEPPQALAKQSTNDPVLDSSLRRLLDSDNSASKSKNSTFDENDIIAKLNELEKDTNGKNEKEDNKNESETKSKKSGLDSSIISKSSSALNASIYSNNESTKSSVLKEDGSENDNEKQENEDNSDDSDEDNFDDSTSHMQSDDDEKQSQENDDESENEENQSKEKDESESQNNYEASDDNEMFKLSFDED